jgi:phospholipid transport system substrate-binding protein
MTRSIPLTALLWFAAPWGPPVFCQEISTASAPANDFPEISTATTAAAEGRKPSTAATPATDAGGIVENTVNSMIDVLKDKANGRDARRRKIFAIMDSVGDLALMGKLTLGPAHWSKFDEAQRKEFIDSFTTVIRDSCFEKVAIYTNETVNFDAPVPAEKGKYGAAVYILSKGKRYKAIFKLYRAKSAWKIYDIEVEGISFIRTYMAQYDQVLQKGSIRELLDKMRAKVLATPAELKNIAEPRKSGTDGKS